LIWLQQVQELHLKIGKQLINPTPIKKMVVMAPCGARPKDSISHAIGNSKSESPKGMMRVVARVVEGPLLHVAIRAIPHPNVKVWNPQWA
jgi:hypothetical protein